LLGIVMREGSTNSHTAILARSFGLPAIIRCREVEDDWDGKYAALDGYDSKLYIEPPRELIDSLMAKRKDELEKETLLSELKGKQSTTIDGHNMKVYANICDPSEVEGVLSNDADGVGLFRSEFIYLNSRTDPPEEEQYRAYRKVLEALAPRPVVIRTSDIGADKAIEYLDLEKEENPALGYRAIRICLSRKDFFKRQLRALLRASAHGNLGIMFPMITCLSEVRECKEVLGECRRELENEGTETGNPETGIMIETPAAALLADELAEEVDFFSLGTNDLTQYTCAIDRQNEKIAAFLDTHNPAVLKLIQMTVEAGHRHNIRVGICGELGADLSLTETFLRMGVDELSVNPGSVLPLRKQIRSITLGENESPG
ncbi:MAG: phosphoenolpyruvate--protein phosphotransferase, partial [Lachnospiraceae bacterium]|nr:phosphoenolpyruvate--protein phosphotransferase [Lachnospiraceae bacterium]